jgi:hypothetical protein
MIRTQVIFPEWLDEYVTRVAPIVGVSKGELIRTMLSVSAILAMKYSGKADFGYDVIGAFKEVLMRNADPDFQLIARKFHDDVQFEARKAWEEGKKNIVQPGK